MIKGGVIMGKEQKELYQNYKNFDSNNVILCFKKAESYENVLQKDLSEWTTMEIIDFYKSLSEGSFTENSLQLHVKTSPAKPFS